MGRKTPRPYLTIEDTAATLRVSERTVRCWITRGIMTARKVGGTWRVPIEAVVEGKPMSARPRRGRRPKALAVSVAALADDVFAKTWDNPQDAVYDRWRRIYGIRKRQCGGVEA